MADVVVAVASTVPGAHHMRAQMKIGCEKPADDSFTFFIEMKGAEMLAYSLGSVRLSD